MYSRDKAMKKVMGAFAQVLSACLLSGSVMHIVVAIPFGDASEMTWEVRVLRLGSNEIIVGTI